MCRSRRELSNEYLLAKIGVDTAENEALAAWGKIIQYYSFVSLAQIRAQPEAEERDRSYLVFDLEVGRGRESVPGEDAAESTAV